MNYVENFNLFGVEAKEIPCIKGSGIPNGTTEGAVGCLYMNKFTGDIYKCIKADEGVYTWKPLNDNNEKDENIIEYNYNHLMIDYADVATANVSVNSQSTEVNLWHSGKNMLPRFDNSANTAGLSFTIDNDGIITINGTVNYSSDYLTSTMRDAYFEGKGKDGIPVNNTGTNYTLSAWFDTSIPFSSGSVIFRVRNNSNQNAITMSIDAADTEGYVCSNGNLTYESTKFKVIDIYFNRIPNGTVFNNWKCKVQLERGGSYYSEYEAPSLNMYTLSVEDGIASKELTLSSGKNYLVTNEDNMYTAIKTSEIDRPLESYFGKRWACFGDSITYKAPDSTALRYHDLVSKELGLSVINYGKATTGYYEDGNQTGIGQYYKRMENIDPSSFDILTIMGSTNDIGAMSRGEVQLGTYLDTGTETVCGCINTTIDKFYELAPLKRLGIITMTPSQYYGPNLIDSSVAENYVNELIKICRNRGIPCLDLYHNSGLRPWVQEFNDAYFSPKEDGTGGDGLHPNDKGVKFFAPLVREFVKSLI